MDSNSSYNNNTFQTSSVEQMFRSDSSVSSATISKNALSWYTRDGRKPSTSLLHEEEEMFKEHLNFISKKKTQNVLALNETEFKVSFFSVNSGSNREINIPKQPLIRFSNLNGMPPQLGENIKKLQFDYMTPIQKVVIPYMQNGKDVVGCSETGSGKTIAYLFPLIGNMLVRGTPQNPYLAQNRNQAYPLSLILVPTRELAEQVYKESKKMCFKTGINSVKVYGGVPQDGQIYALQEGCDILIATPGRLIDHIKRNRISLKMISQLIIDEAERMLDMGFEEQLKQIVSSFDMPDKEKRQNLMFSATFSEEVKDIAQKFLKDYYFVQPKNQAPKQIVQEIIKAEDFDKPKILCDILRKTQGSVLIFMDTKKGVDELAYNLNNENFKVVSIHGDRNQFQRQHAITSFATGTAPILIATDVASRGLDFPNVNCVVNYEMPKNIEDYIHRIGRTGRIGQVGRAVSFLNFQNKMIFRKLYLLLRSQRQNIPDWFEKANQETGELGFKKTIPWNTSEAKGGNENNWNNNNIISWGPGSSNTNTWSNSNGNSKNHTSLTANNGNNENGGWNKSNGGGWQNDKSPSHHSEEALDINKTKRSRSRSRSNNKNSGGWSNVNGNNTQQSSGW